MKLQKMIMIRRTTLLTVLLVLLSYGITYTSADEVAKAEAKAESSTYRDTHRHKECAGKHGHSIKSTEMGDEPRVEPKSSQLESPSKQAKPVPSPKGHKTDPEPLPKRTEEQIQPDVSTNKEQSKQEAGPIPHSDIHKEKDELHDSDKRTKPRSPDKETDTVPSRGVPKCDSKPLTEETKKENYHEAPATEAQPGGKSLSSGSSDESQGLSKLEQPGPPSEESKPASSQTNPDPAAEETEVEDDI